MDTLYCDVSEWQVAVDDFYPHPVLCIRSNDGTYLDKNWQDELLMVQESDGQRETGFLHRLLRLAAKLVGRRERPEKPSGAPPSEDGGDARC